MYTTIRHWYFEITDVLALIHNDSLVYVARQQKTAVCANIILHYLQFPCHYSGWGQIGPKLGGSLGNFGKYIHINVNILTFTKLKINININLYITLVMRLIMESNTYIFNRLKPLLKPQN